MLVEPPRPQLPARSASLSRIPASAVPLALAGAALLLAVTSRGDAIVLGVVLILLAGHRLAVPAVATALLASSWRWGATSLEALSGAQAVLGPAGGVGPPAAAVGSWLAGVAILLAGARGTEVAGRLEPVDVARSTAIGAAVAAVLAGPAPGGDLGVRVVVGFGVAVAASGLSYLRGQRGRLDGIVDALAVLTGVAAVVAVAPDAPSWPPSVELATVVEGVALALAGAAVVSAGLAAAAVTTWRRDVGRRPVGRSLDRASGAPSARPR